MQRLQRRCAMRISPTPRPLLCRPSLQPLPLLRCAINPQPISLRCARTFSSATPRFSLPSDCFPASRLRTSPLVSPIRTLTVAASVAAAPKRHLLRRIGRAVALLLLLLIILIFLYFPEVTQRTTSSFRTAIRFSRAVWAATLISLDYKWSLHGLTEQERSARISEVHLRSARRLRELFQRNAGIFIKAGQHIAALDYLVPEEYTSTMRVFQDRAPHLSIEEIRPMLEKELGCPLASVFESFDAEPIASASLAQVHRATLRIAREEGFKEVAVKVQFPGLQERCQGDVRTIAFIIEVVSRVFPEFKLKWLVDEFNRNLPLELDFQHEARNSERVARNFVNDPLFATPRIVWPLTCSRVLTMEYVRGFKPNDLAALRKHAISPESVVALLGHVFNEQVFSHGFVHCDPHPGNVLLRFSPTNGNLQLVLLDHGLYRELSAPFVTDYARLWLSLIRGDAQEVQSICSRLAPGSDHRDLASMLTARAWSSGETKLDSVMTDAERDLIRKNAARVADITGILAKVPSDLLLLFKTNDLLRSLNNDLGLPHSTASYALMLRYAQSCVNAQRTKTDRSWRMWAITTKDTLLLEAKLRLAPIYLWISSRLRKAPSQPPIPVTVTPVIASK